MSDLTAKTRDFRDAMFDSTVPWQMIDSAAGRVSVIRCVIHVNKNTNPANHKTDMST